MTARQIAKEKQARVVRPRAGARDRLIETAERLFAEHGVEGVSLRRIAAGEANNSVIQYHFGGKAGLIREIIRRRVATFEMRRRAMLDAATAEGRLADIPMLLKIVLLPLAEATDADGRHIYARFMVQFLTQFQHQEGMTHPGWGADSAGTRAAELLAKELSFLPVPRLTARLNRLAVFFLSALIERDAAKANGKPVEPEATFFEDLFAMIAAAMQLPPPQSEA